MHKSVTTSGAFEMRRNLTTKFAALSIMILMCIPLAAEVTHKFIGSVTGYNSTVSCTRYMTTKDPSKSAVEIAIKSQEVSTEYRILLSHDEVRQIIKDIGEAEKWHEANPGQGREDEFLKVEYEDKVIVVAVFGESVVLFICKFGSRGTNRLHVLENERAVDELIKLLSDANEMPY